MDIFDVLNMVGGLALFLYGMSTLGDSLSKIAGGKLEGILERLTSKKLWAVLLGMAVTAIIQSSSATTVMVVGFVNSGIMKLSQAVGIIMGANIGTTATSWLLSLTGIEGNSWWLQLLKPTSFTPVLAVIGMVLIMSKNDSKNHRDIGEALLGFAILMFGMETMSSSVAGLADNPAFANLMLSFSNPLLGVAVGAVITAIIQSSSASTGILQALCLSGAISYGAAIPIIMGQNIGTCVTSILSSVGASKNARRAAMVHLYFNVIGTVVFMALFYLLNIFIDFSFMSMTASVVGIAVIHSCFNIFTTVLLYPLSDVLVKMAEFTIKDVAEAKETVSRRDIIGIDERFLDNPAFAMEICRGRMRQMAENTQLAIMLALDVLQKYDAKKAAEVDRLEHLIDGYEDELGSYLLKLAGKEISLQDSKSMSVILHSISDFERISDHALEVAEAAKEMHEKGLSFSPRAQIEIRTLCRAVNDICNDTIDSFITNDLVAAGHIEPLEEVIDTLTKRIKENHILRLQQGICSIEMGFILEDILMGLERVSDHCSNVAVEMLTINRNDYNTHEYFENISPSRRESFEREYAALLQRYPFE